jgi:REP element-mobilizing transposase RayT
MSTSTVCVPVEGAECGFQYHPDMELSKLVNNLKSISSRKISQEFAAHDGKVLLEGFILEWFLFCLKLWGG